MSKETMEYIFSFDSKSGVFTLTSSKDQLTINLKHKKYEWLKGQETGRIIKISDKGRWTSSNDYDNLYQIIKPIKKAEKKSTSSNNTTEKSGAYGFLFIENDNQFVLTDQNGNEIKVTSKHKKFEWLQSQDSGRVIKISDKGRWNSSKDYDGLYGKLKSVKNKPTKPSVSKPTTQKPKSDNSDETKKLNEEIKNLQSTIQNLRDKLKKLDSNYNELKKDKAAIELLLKKKSQPAKPKATKKVEKIVARKHWNIKFMATESYTYHGRKIKSECTIRLETELIERPTKSYAKALLRQHIVRKRRKYPIKFIGGLNHTYLVLAGDYKLTNITILGIEEW